MESFADYLLRSAVWLTGFSIVYFIFLRNERFFNIKRFYLVAGITAAFLLPLFTIHYTVEIPAPQIPDYGLIPQMTSGNPVADPSLQTKSGLDYRHSLLFLYVSGVLLLLLRLTVQVWKLSGVIRKSTLIKHGMARIVSISATPSSFSFLNYIFINSSLKVDEAEHVLNHEKVHIEQKHWLDLILAELTRIFQWANPFAWIYLKFIKQNHEYIADQAALNLTANPENYRATLLNQIFNSRILSLTNSFNYSMNKKRFDMMEKMITSPYRKLKVLLILPVMATVFYAFATPKYEYIPVDSNSSLNELIIGEAAPIIQKEVKGFVLNKDGKPIKNAVIIIYGKTGESQRVLSDDAGRFSINPSPDAYLSISCQGYVGKTIKPPVEPELKVVLETAASAIPQIDTLEMMKKKTDMLSIQPEPLYILNGEVISKSEIKNLDVTRIRNISMINNQSIVDTYGEKAKEGAVIIVTKDFKPRPIIVIDDVVSPLSYEEAYKGVMDQIGLSKVLSAKDAIAKYGEKAKLGAIEITTIKRAKELGIKIPFRRKNPEDFPTFQGKSELFFGDWVASQIKYPAEATSAGLQGLAIAEFTVETDGSISNIKYTLAPDKQTGEALVKAIQSSPKWDPAKNPEANEPYKTTVTINFELPDKVSTDNVPFVVVEQMPRFPGGDAELLKFIAENTHYPDSAKAKNIQGRVIVRFAISKEGQVGNVTILKGVDPLLDEEAMRITKLLPDFAPGYQGGKPVSVWYMIPITFTLK